MGNKNTSTNNRDINQLSDACRLSKIVTRAVGLRSNSASQTDTIMLTLENNLNYQKNITGPNKKAFMKYWINYDYEIGNEMDKNPLTNGLLDSFASAGKSLQYELMVYRDIIRILIDEKKCTNFIQCYASSSSCDSDSILSIILKAFPAITKKKAKSNFLNNLSYMVTGTRNRPSVTSSAPNPILYTTIYSWLLTLYQKISYGFIVTEYREGTTFQNWYLTAASGGDIQTTLKLLFQICFACYTMYFSKVSHNDLHLENVRLATDLVNNEKIFTYITDEIDITFDCDLKAMIYDFDRSYSPIVGMNDFLTKDCGIRPDCNKIREGYDFTYFIICLIQFECRNSSNYYIVVNLLKIIAKNKSEYNKIIGILGININKTTRTITTPSSFKHPIDCMKFNYRKYNIILSIIQQKILVDIYLPKATININTILKKDFNKTSGKLINIYNNKDCP